MTNKLANYPCPCCGYIVFEEPPGSYDICPICFWEDDLSQLRLARRGGGANRVSLLEAQRSFAALGVSEPRFAKEVRPPSASDHRDLSWRRLEEHGDDVEEAVPGVDCGATYPADPTTLYYWRGTFWRRRAAT